MVASASTQGRQHQLLAAVADALRQSSEPGSRLRVSRPSRKTAELVAGRRPGLLETPLQLNATEFAGVSGWPIGVGATPGLSRGVSRTLPAPRTHGDTVIARSVGITSHHPITAGVEDRLHHLHLLGPTGVGKSHLITQLASQDAAAGRGVIVVDPKGDLVDAIIERLPQDRLFDVIVIDPGDGDRVVGFNPLNAGLPELVVDQLVSVMHDLYRSSWGPRTADVLRATLTTLTADSARLEPDQRWTLVDVPAVLTDDRLRRALHRRRKGNDPDLDGYWQWYESLSAPERSQVIAPVLNKLRAITLRPSLRNTLGQSEGIQLSEILHDSKILLVSLRRSTLGPESARLLGSLLVSQLWNAVTARASIAKAGRTPAFVYLDEVQDLLHTPVDLGDALAQARGLGVGFTLAHQHFDQLGSDLRAAVQANARSKVVFRLSHDDARRMAREFEPELTVDDLKGLPAREMAIQLLARGNRIVATGIADALPRATSGQLASVRDQSRRRYGMNRSDIDEAIRKRRRQQPQHRGPPGREPA